MNIPGTAAICRPPDRAYLAKRANDPQSADPLGMVFSPEWTMRTADGAEIPVYATPANAGSPIAVSTGCISFCSVVRSSAEISGEELILYAEHADALQEVRILPEGAPVTGRLEGDKFVLRVKGCARFVLEANRRPGAPLFVSVEEVCPAPDLQDPAVLYYPPGVHLVDQIALQSGQTLYIDKGAVLRAKPPEETPINACDWAAQPNYGPFISARNQENITITGGGIIDTSLLPWHARGTIFLAGCRHVRISNITTVNAASWTVHLFDLEDVQLENLKIYGYRTNSDGIDLVNCRRVSVRDCLVRTGDDGICLKSTDPRKIGGADVVVENCAVWNDKARCLGITCETRSDIYNVLFKNCDILHSYPKWAMELGSLCVIVCDSGHIHDIVFEDIRIAHEDHYAVCVAQMKDFWSKEKTVGKISRITFRRVSIPAGVPSLIQGYDAEHPVNDVLFEDVRVGDRTAMCPEDIQLHRQYSDIRFTAD